MRYIRQEIFNKIGKKGQQKLGKSTIAIVGIGALGSVAANLLARAGIGRLVLIDRDIVELSNLQRQSLFYESDVGKPKAICAKQHLTKINSDIEIISVIDDLNFNNINEIFPMDRKFTSINGTTKSNNVQTNKKIINKNNNQKLNKQIKAQKNKIDLILDCTDNLETRFLINDYCIKNKIPFIYSSAVGSKGYVFNVIPNETACLRCFLKETAQLDTCETVGVLNTITSLISSIQTNEAIKILLQKNNMEKSLLFFDIWKGELSKIKVNKNKNCTCCIKNNFEYLNGRKFTKAVKLCGNNVYQIKTKSINHDQFSELKSKLKKIGKIIDFDYCINFDSKLTIFQDGRALIKAKGEKEAKSVYSKFIGN